MTLPRPEYPRPILVRDRWLNLNGEWRFASDPTDAGLHGGWARDGLPPEQLQTIVVPYPIESTASGIQDLNPAPVNWYERTVEIPADWEHNAVLHVGACDYEMRLFVNGHETGQHQGGYSPATFDISAALQPGSNRITIRVWDGDSWTQPRGKQAGTTKWPIDYDTVTGIWQTVWLEPLPPSAVVATQSVFSLEKSADGVLSGKLQYTALFNHQVRGQLTVDLSLNGKTIASAQARTGGRAEARTTLTIDEPQLWSPATPTLYDIHLQLEDENGNIDRAQSYVGLRTIDVQDGVLRLNEQALYLRGVLDQGYFPDGWYTALTDDDLKADVELTLQMGFNCARKHQKAEDPRYLYWADKLGLLVWAEMPSGRVYSNELVQALTTQWIELVTRDRAHPSVIAWVPFNESWGVWNQAERPEQRALVNALVSLTHSLDSSRPVVGNDGWEYSSGDLWTLHLYDDGSHRIRERLDELIQDPTQLVTGEGSPTDGRNGALPGASVEGLPIILSECGGVGFGRFSDEDFSYGELPRTESELENEMIQLMNAIRAADQLQGFVWTQLTDIQQEINGICYFDRKPKLPLATLRRIFSA